MDIITIETGWTPLGQFYRTHCIEGNLLRRRGLTEVWGSGQYSKGRFKMLTYKSNLTKGVCIIFKYKS